MPRFERLAIYKKTDFPPLSSVSQILTVVVTAGVTNEAVRADHQDTNEPIGPSVVVLVAGAEY
ncbi:hypothetical protein CGLO_08505 [Colletotrichum gloeosporioides Cg-14]|uniref:Uncharacterized protein n=1 Tax=Colletotrichum gloeosporioides (strain Cg-14) TaxID=1237896 RepID=T0LUH4_COLGC|nr:hypothetical protein CGLO_08505 [Colletotrichum gloeosporioides Cg-14]